MPTTPRPFPWKCGTCRERGVVRSVIPYSVELEHDGRPYQITLPDLSVLRCERCGTIVLDDAADERISEALRQEAGLLTPEVIRGRRQALGLTQKQLAGYLGIAEATLSRWETGAQIQQRSLDRFMRILFAYPSVRAVLSRPSQPQPEQATSPRFLFVKLTTQLLDRARRFTFRRVAAEKPEKATSSVPEGSSANSPIEA